MGNNRQGGQGLGGYVGQVGADQVERRTNSGQQVPLKKMDRAGDASPDGVAARHLQSRSREVTGRYLQTSNVERQGDRYAARAGAHVRRTVGGGMDVQPSQSLFDQQFGFRARDEHSWADFEVQTVKLLVAQDVG